jgi:hypothetical protein
MDKYYYFAAQLPLLTFENEEFPSIEWFLREADKWMDDRDLNQLKAVNLDPLAMGRVTNPTARDWYDFELRLRTELMRWRQSQRENYEYRVTAFPMSLVKEGNPLEVEKKLLQLRWQYLDELSSGHYSDLDFFVVYYLKLLILERLAAMDTVRGQERFEQVTRLEPVHDVIET